MRRRTISVFLSLMLCLSLLSACGTTTDMPTNGSNRDIAFEETQQEEQAEGSDSTTSENGESASDPESGKDDSVSDKAQPSQPEQNANENMYLFEIDTVSFENAGQPRRVYLRRCSFSDDLDFIRAVDHRKHQKYPNQLAGRGRYSEQKHCCVFSDTAIMIAQETGCEDDWQE